MWESGIVYDIQKDVFAQTVAVEMVRGVRMRDASFALQTVTSSPTTVGGIGQIVVAVGMEQTSRSCAIRTLHV